MGYNSEENSISQDKNLATKSQTFINRAKELIDSYEQDANQRGKEFYKNLVDLGHSYELDDFEINLLLTDLLDHKIAKTSLSNYRKEFLKLEHSTSRSNKIAAKKVIEQSTTKPIVKIYPQYEPDKEITITLPQTNLTIDEPETEQEDNWIYLTKQQLEKFRLEININLRNMATQTMIRLKTDVTTNSMLMEIMPA